MTRRRTFLGLIAALGAVVAQPALAQSAPADGGIATIDHALSDAALKGFGGAVVVEQGGKTLLAKGYGFADRERRIPFTPDTIAQIGSITKSQTAAALVTLIAEGKVKLSDPVSKFVPEAPEPGRSRTVAQLASHSSGLLDSCTDDFEPQSEAMLVSTCLARPLAHKVGDDEYSNMGYSVLALIVQRVTGKPWEEALRERVWNPLGMKAVGFYFRGQSDDQFSRGYLKNVEQPVISREIAKLHGSDWALRGNGGIQASSRAMIRFLDGVLDPNGGYPPAARKILLSPVPGQTGEVREGFGFAFRYNEDGSLYRMGHAGSDGTFFSYLCWFPANDVRFYFVGNNGEDEAKAVLLQALKGASHLPPAGSAAR
ncbi:MAG: serine hydrolase domain-containing protein [Sphingomicrobium sp.]